MKEGLSVKVNDREHLLGVDHLTSIQLSFSVNQPCIIVYLVFVILLLLLLFHCPREASLCLACTGPVKHTHTP